MDFRRKHPWVAGWPAAHGSSCRFLAHNLSIGFQLHSNLATTKPHTAKRTYGFWLVSMKTLRFTIINRAARVARIRGRKVLRFSHNPAAQVLYDQVLDRLAA